VFIAHWLCLLTRLYKYWTLLDQPHYSVQNPQYSKRNCGRSSENSSFHPVDINWWTEHVSFFLLFIIVEIVCIKALFPKLLNSADYLSNPASPCGPSHLSHLFAYISSVNKYSHLNVCAFFSNFLNGVHVLVYLRKIWLILWKFYSQTSF